MAATKDKGEIRWETLGGPNGKAIAIATSSLHKFGTDGILLAAFAAPTAKDLCCDLCSGGGIVPLYWQGGVAPGCCYAIEIQPEAVALLEASVQANHLEQVILPLCLDLKALKSLPQPGAFDVVTCNPPYKPAGSGVPSPEKSRLAARHETDCTIGDVCAAAARLLRPSGRFCLCQRPARLADTLEAMRKSGIEPKRIRFVQQRPALAPWLFLAEGRRNGGPFLQIEPPLIIEGEDGFSEEMLAIYRKGAE